MRRLHRRMLSSNVIIDNYSRIELEILCTQYVRIRFVVIHLRKLRSAGKHNQILRVEWKMRLLASFYMKFNKFGRNLEDIKLLILA